jgi:serine/threonine-protein kinase
MHLELPRSIRPPGARTATATEEGRAFFQERLSIFGLCLFVLAGGSWLLLALAYWFGSGLNEHGPFSWGGLLHLSNALLAGGLWWATRREKRTGLQLHALDAGAALALVAVWGLMGASLPVPIGAFVALLSFTLGTLARAIVVPSTAWRTLAIGVLGAGILVLFTVWHNGLSRSVLGGAIATSSWALSGTAIATLASHTIFGLRREVQKARVLGQYTLEVKIGSGGMGDVWRASHALLRRPTAIKLLRPGKLDDNAIARFEREVQLTARLTHPNTVSIYDFGRTRDGVFYYAMELLEGIDLEQLVREHGPQPAERVIHLLLQLCGALAEAHELGLVHRDVKPQNVLLCPRKNDQEYTKLLDFGLVKTLHPHPESGLTEAALTGVNTLAGTPLYMSPEAIQAPESVDARSDLYALGVVAWYLLVGHPPFEANSIIEVCGQHLHAVPRRPSVALRASVPSDLEDIVLTCLEKRPEDRPASARELRRLLEGCELEQRWTTERSMDWWRTRSNSIPLSEPPPSISQTLALDLTAREQPAAPELAARAS